MEPFLNQPTGTITFLFTDIEGSTKLWERCPEAMRLALAIHDSLLRQAIEQNNGYVFKTVGDAFCAAFLTAPEALTAAIDAHFALLKQDWGGTGPIRVRMGLHTGDAEVRDDDDFGPTLNRAARLQSIAYGCQTLLSQSTYELVRDRLPEKVTLNALGTRRLWHTSARDWTASRSRSSWRRRASARLRWKRSTASSTRALCPRSMMNGAHGTGCWKPSGSTPATACWKAGKRMPCGSGTATSIYRWRRRRSRSCRGRTR